MKAIGLVTVSAILLGTSAKGAELVIPATVQSTVQSEREQKLNRYLFQFEIPEASSNAKIDRATLRVDIDRSVLVSDALELRILPVQEDWSVRGTASQVPASNDSAGISWIIQKTDSGHAMIDLQPIVQDWVGGRLANKGILIMPLEAPEADVSLREFSSKGSVIRAELHLKYRPNSRIGENSR